MQTGSAADKFSMLQETLVCVVTDIRPFLIALYLACDGHSNIPKFYIDACKDPNISPLKNFNPRLLNRSDLRLHTALGPCKCGVSQCDRCLDCCGCGTSCSFIICESYCQSGLTKIYGTTTEPLKLL